MSKPDDEFEFADIPLPEISRQITVRPAEHEVFLAFNSDWHAAAYTDWLIEVGFKAFRAWAVEKREEYTG